MVSSDDPAGEGGSEGEGAPHPSSTILSEQDDDSAPAVASARDRDWARRAALVYLERYASSEANLVRVLKRKVRRRAEASGRPIAEPERLIAEAVEACRALGLLNDTAFAETKVAAGRRKGLSRGRMMATLAAKGVDRAVAEAAVADDAPDDLVAALRFARRRRLGPWRSPGRGSDNPANRPSDRDTRDIAALCRAGHPYATSRTAITMPLETAEAHLTADE